MVPTEEDQAERWSKLVLKEAQGEDDPVIGMDVEVGPSR